jgi:hypothetical protein
MENIKTILNILQEGVGALALVSALTLSLVQVVKEVLPDLNKRWVPLFSLAIGIGFGILFIGVTVAGFVIGLIAGLSAIGLWEVGKTTVVGK